MFWSQKPERTSSKAVDCKSLRDFIRLRETARAPSSSTVAFTDCSNVEINDDDKVWLRLRKTTMQFNLDQATDLLSRTPVTLRSLLGNLPDEWTSGNEGEQTWAPFDVLGHLIHGELTDWIPRIKMILEAGESKTFEPFDRFAQKDASQGKRMEELLATFEALRANNIETLHQLNITAENLKSRGKHPELGTVTLEALIATWVVHDLDHLLQISRTLAKQYKEAVGPWQAYLSVLK